MERLTGLDAGFLYMETPTQHMHTLKIAILDPSTVPSGYRFERVKEVLAARLHLLPPFRRRLVDVPFNLHHPVWIEDPDFDLDYHVRRVAVPAPGGQEELDELISRIASHQLDRRHPLWEVWVVEGLEHDHIGFVAKIHHCMADGVKAAELLVNVFDTGPDAPPPAPPARPWQPEVIPSGGHLLGQAIVAMMRALLGVPALGRRTLQGFRAVARRRRSGAVSPPLPFSASTTSCSRRARARCAVTSKRVESCPTDRSSPGSRCRRAPRRRAAWPTASPTCSRPYRSTSPIRSRA
jgi:WS/DGAT/MGAT family acyltransferase